MALAESITPERRLAPDAGVDAPPVAGVDRYLHMGEPEGDGGDGGRVTGPLIRKRQRAAAPEGRRLS